jgi:glycosyltransferase involved in cell wall biosynthesis
MKVLFIGNFRDGTGWSRSAIEYIMALDAADVKVVPRCIKLNGVSGEVPERILELERQSAKDCDVVIQHVLPHMLEYDGHFQKRIAIYMTEASNFKRTGWAEKINEMDEAWVPCHYSHLASIDSGVTIPMHVMPIPCNPSLYTQHYEALNFPELNGKFKFYFIGDVTRRKNLAALIRAFYAEFDPFEDVGLVIKANYGNAPPEVCDKKVRDLIATVQKQLNLYKSTNVFSGAVVITQRLSDVQMMQLHATCDCLVAPSYAEGWHLPAFDAMCMGKTPIVTNCTSFPEFLSDNEGYLVDCRREPIFGMADDSSVPDLYTAKESWFSIDVDELRRVMRMAYNDHEDRKERSQNGMDKASKFSYYEIGKVMKKRILERGV